MNNLRRQYKVVVFVIVVCLCLLQTGTTSTAAAITATDVLQQRQAMNSSAINDIQTTSTVPYYTINGTVNPTTRTFTGTQTIVYTNRTTASLANIGLRLYPNLTDVGGTCILTSVKVNGRAVTPIFVHNGSSSPSRLQRH